MRLRDLFRRNKGEKKAEKSPPCPPPLDMLLKKEPEGEDIAFWVLGNSCALGDIEAMMEMAERFRAQLSREAKELLECCEAGGGRDGELADYLKAGSADSFRLKAYMMWVLRAALYGHERAARILEKCPCYRELASVPEEIFRPGRKAFRKFCSTSELYKLGFTKVPRDKDECTLCSMTPKRYYVLSYQSWYCPPDETGFGMEEEFDYYYFDEFFCRIEAGSKEEAEAGALRLEKVREDYWSRPESHAERRRYRY